MVTRTTATLRIVLGDQLDPGALEGLDPRTDALWMAEVPSETQTETSRSDTWENPYGALSHKHRVVMFLSAMRHFAQAREDEGWTVFYRKLSTKPTPSEPRNHGSALAQDLRKIRPQRVEVLQPGDHRVQACLAQACPDLAIVEDPHFLCPLPDFEQWASGRKALVLAHFYRMLRKKHGILMDGSGQPEGGSWDFDIKNRKSFGKAGPPSIEALPEAPWDDITSEVAELVDTRFANYPGNSEDFRMPVTQEQARALADHFFDNYLAQFGPYQDAMWTDDPILWHSRLSAPLNLKLIDPRYLLEKAEQAYRQGSASIESVEGFIRQILGWREFIRGIYYTRMPQYAALNALECDDRPVPPFFWDGETDMTCVAESARGLVRYAYVHHIHRLMVFGVFALQLGVHPKRFHEWHMSMYLDAVDWVSLPNTLGMSQYGDGGVVGTKPYAATGKYIKRMSNFCKRCNYDPEKSSGAGACPFTVLYWDFLDRHRTKFEKNRRMALQVKNLERKSAEDMTAIRRSAQALRDRIDAGERV